MIQGSLDALSGERAVGWAYSSLAREALKVQATIDNQIIGEAIADLFRPDLAHAGLGSGHCGFEIRFQKVVDPIYWPFVDVRPSGGTLALPRTSTAGFSDYFSSLYRRYPCVGRYASVLGGLWTDRSDATALLKARVDTGVIAQVDAGILSRFIQEGLVVCDLGAQRKPESLPRGDDVAVSSCVFFHEDTLRLLRVILEDHPIAVKAYVCRPGEKIYAQPSAWDDVPSPPECVGLIVPLANAEVFVEVLRGSHRFPEFSSDGTSRWTTEGRARANAASSYPNVFADDFRIAAGGVAVLGPGVIHRVRVASAKQALRLLALPSRLGSVRFRQQTPAGELTHGSGARMWIAAATV
jgi:hypothetical protein